MTVDDLAAQLETALFKPGVDYTQRLQLISQFPQAELSVALVQLLEDALRHEEWFRFNSFVEIAFDRATPAMAPVLEASLDAREQQINNENVVDLLGGIGQESSLGVLERTLFWFPSWDDASWIARKCVSALAHLQSTGARAALQRAATEAPAQVAREATEALRSTPDLGQ